MGDEEAFVRACIAAPTDDLVRLGYADWFEERGDVRARYLRLEPEICTRQERMEESAELESELTALHDRIDPGWVERAGLKCDLVLQAFRADAKICIIKRVREVTGLGLKEARDLVEAAPVVVLRSVPVLRAIQVKACFGAQEIAYDTLPPGDGTPVRYAWIGAQVRIASPHGHYWERRHRVVVTISRAGACPQRCRFTAADGSAWEMTTETATFVWGLARYLAERFGWEADGTELPVRVTASDATGLCVALRAALAAPEFESLIVSWGPPVLVRCSAALASPEFDRLTAAYEAAPLDVCRQWLQEFAAFCERGAFSIH